MARFYHEEENMAIGRSERLQLSSEMFPTTVTLVCLEKKCFRDIMFFMEIRTLKYFLAVAREEGVNRAANVLNVTQPTLSRQMAQLEDELGVRLFERGARRITLTTEGFFFKRRAEEILSLVEKTEQEVSTQTADIEGKVSIGCGELSAVGFLPELFREFNEKYPLVTYDIFTATADTIKESLEKGLVDMGVLLEPVDLEKLDFVRLEKKERWVARMRSDDPLAKKKGVTAKDLLDRSLIIPRRTNVQSELAAWFGDSFSQAKILFTSNLSTNSVIMVLAGLGISLGVEVHDYIWDKSKIVSVPLSPAFASDSVFAWKKEHSFSPAAEKFIAMVRKKYGRG